MTARQKEFCRHYLRGLTAPQAARAAGYAACTAEKNAADILRSASVQEYLARHRQAQVLVDARHLAQGRDRMLEIVATGGEKAAALAYHALIRLYRLQHQFLPEELPDSPQPVTTENHAQLSDDQQNHPVDSVPETDTLPDGTPAYDQAFTPRRADSHKSKAHLAVRFDTRTPRLKPPTSPLQASP